MNELILFYLRVLPGCREANSLLVPHTSYSSCHVIWHDHSSSVTLSSSVTFKFCDTQHRVAVAVCRTTLPTEHRATRLELPLASFQGILQLEMLASSIFGIWQDEWKVQNAYNMCKHSIFLPLHYLTTSYGHILLHTFPCCKNVSFDSMANYFHNNTWEPHSCPPTIHHTHTLFACWNGGGQGNRGTSHLPPMLSLLL